MHRQFLHVQTSFLSFIFCQYPSFQDDASSIPGSGRCPEEENGSPYIFLPGKSQGERSLAGSSLWGPKESDRI